MKRFLQVILTRFGLRLTSLIYLITWFLFRSLLVELLQLSFIFFTCEGDDGRDFINVELCGDEFLALLAESMQDTEDWDDLQAIESEACGALADMLGKDTREDCEVDCDEDSGAYVHVIEDSPQQQRHAKTVLLDSSSESEEMGIRFASKEDLPSTSKIRRDRIHQGMTPQSGCRASTLMVVLI